MILEIGRLLSLRPRSLSGWKFSNRVRVGVSVEHRGLHARAEDAQVLSTRRGGASALAQHQVEARDVLGTNSPDPLPAEHMLRVDDR